MLIATKLYKSDLSLHICVDTSQTVLERKPGTQAQPPTFLNVAAGIETRAKCFI